MLKDPKRRYYRAVFFIVLSLCILVNWGFPSQPSAKEASDVTSLEGAFIDVANKVKPSVVSIFSETTVTWEGFGEEFFRGSPFEEFFKRFGRPPGEHKQKRRQMGSGVIIDESGYVITNHHVVAEADKITVRLYDGSELDGTIKGSDPKTDLAVVQIKGENLTPATLGDSDKLRVGQWAIAIGSPFGLEETVTVGVISATGRSGFGTGTYEDFIQTDASINQGNSGGALSNIRGEVIGINAMIIPTWQGGQGIGFAIPINLAKSISQQLIRGGKVTRAWIGIGIQDLTHELRKQFGLSDKEGVLINKIFPDSPAERADIKIGDIIKEIDGQKVKNSRELIQHVLKKEVGQEVTLKIIRNGKEMTILVKTQEMPGEITGEAEVPEMKKGWFGLGVEEITPQLAKRWGITRDRGVVIVEVEPGSSGQNAGLQPGDVILEVDRKDIKGIKDYQRAMEGANRKEVVLLLVNRQGNNIFVTLQEG